MPFGGAKIQKSQKIRKSGGTVNNAKIRRFLGPARSLCGANVVNNLGLKKNNLIFLCDFQIKA